MRTKVLTGIPGPFPAKVKDRDLFVLILDTGAPIFGELGNLGRLEPDGGLLGANACRIL
jgi:hypothetical protein